MKKFALGLLLVAGVAVVYFSVVTSPERRSIEPDDTNTSVEEENPETGSDGVTRTRGFSAPFYPDAEAEEPTWVFEGEESMVGAPEGWVGNPVIKHFPREGGPVERVTIRADSATRQEENVAFLEGNVQIETDTGKRLSANRLYAMLDEEEFRIPDTVPVQLSGTGFEVSGYGFEGHVQLHEFTLNRNINLQIREGLLGGSSPGDDAEISRTIGERTLVTGNGPLEMGRKNRSDRGDTWEAAFQGNVFLYRSRPEGVTQVRCESLVANVVAGKSASNISASGENQSMSDPSTARLTDVSGTGNVRVQSPVFETRSDALQIQFHENGETIHLQGKNERQIVRYRRQSDGETNPFGLSTSHPAGAGTNVRTEIRFSGPGRLETTYSQSEEGTNESFRGEAEFQERVIVDAGRPRLEGNRVSFSYSGNPSNQGRRSRGGTQSLRHISLTGLSATGNVFLVRSPLSIVADQFSWNHKLGTLVFQADQNVELSDLNNRLQANEIRVLDEYGSVRATGNVKATIPIRGGDQIAGLVPGQTDQNPETGSRVEAWNIESDTLSVDLHSESSRLQEMVAGGTVRLTSGNRQATGHRFRINADQETASLLGKGEEPARIEQGPHSAEAMRITYHFGDRRAVIRQPRRFHFSYRSGSEAEGNRSEMSLYTRSPVVVHRTRGRIRLTGPSRIQRPGSYLRADRLSLQYDTTLDDYLREVRGTGDIFLHDTRGGARADIVVWSPREDRFTLKGQPWAQVMNEDGFFRAEIITMDRRGEIGLQRTEPGRMWEEPITEIWR